jgi:uncharacterized protein
MSLNTTHDATQSQCYSVSMPPHYSDYALQHRQRSARHQQQMQQRHQQGLLRSQEAAKLLKQEFGAEAVFLFGSLLTPERIHSASDIDLAVWGLALDRYCEAIGVLLCQTKEFNVDLVRLEMAQPELVDHILSRGVEL